MYSVKVDSIIFFYFQKCCTASIWEHGAWCIVKTLRQVINKPVFQSVLVPCEPQPLNGCIIIFKPRSHSMFLGMLYTGAKKFWNWSITSGSIHEKGCNDYKIILGGKCTHQNMTGSDCCSKCLKTLWKALLFPTESLFQPAVSDGEQLYCYQAAGYQTPLTKTFYLAQHRSLSLSGISWILYNCVFALSDNY